MLPTHDQWARLVRALADRGIHLLSDEVYRFLEFDEADRLIAGADAFQRGVSLGVMSKSFAMAGLRIGWLATRDRDLLARCAAFKDYTTICSSAPSEILALIGLRAREQVLARSLRIVDDNLALLDGFFRTAPIASPGFGPAAARSASRGCSATSRSMTSPRGWSRPRACCCCPARSSGYPGNHFRIGFGREDLPEALARPRALPGAQHRLADANRTSPYARPRTP